MREIYALHPISYRLGRFCGRGRAECDRLSSGDTRAEEKAMPLSRETSAGTPTVSPADVRAMLKDGGEMALLDVREEGVFSEQGHPFFANSVPLSRLELLIRDLVPRPLARIVVYDGGGEGLAERAAAKLAAMGYRDLAVMAGGAHGWAAAGYELFTGVNVPSKAFGELVEHRCETPHIAAAELQRRLDAGENVLIVDSRPIGEFRNMSIPGAFDCPGAELVYRVPDRVPSPETLVVVNCAGRTRSIIGAQSLRNAGLANPVVALENGTMGWEMAGLELARGREDALPPPSPNGLRRAQALSNKVAERFAIRRIDDAALDRFRAEAEQRTLYLFDVRSPEEYLAGHLPGARSAPGGQLVQATDVYMATRNPRIVLIDDDGVRAVMTGSWLVQMGWPEVYVVDGGLKGRRLVPGMPKPVIPELDAAMVATVSPAELRASLDKGEAVVVDLAPSLAYEAGHIPGAWFAVRARLPESLDRVPKRRMLVLTSPDAALAHFAAAELGEGGFVEVRVLDGGTAAWRTAGLPPAAGREAMADTPDDCWRRPYDPYAAPDARERYLRWEIELIRQIEREGDTGFRVSA
jgi:rhodanese-related sulfurtransferase